MWHGPHRRRGYSRGPRAPVVLLLLTVAILGAALAMAPPADQVPAPATLLSAPKPALKPAPKSAPKTVPKTAPGSHGGPASGHHRNPKRHHRRTHPNGPQLEAPSHWQEDEASAQACPNCEKLHKAQLELSELQQQVTSKSLRMEAIKYKILYKLGLKGKPNVTHAVPKSVAQAIIANMNLNSDPGVGLGQQGLGQKQSSDASTTLHAPEQDNQQPDVEQEEVYGRASEIVAFAEPGHTLNSQRLLDFSLEEEGLPIQEATLWVRVDIRKGSRKVTDRNLTLWVFRVHGKHFNTSHVSDEDFDTYTSMAGSLSVTLSKVGWVKVNLTQAVLQWYRGGSGSRGRLRLLVDCSGCGELVSLLRPETIQDDRRRPFLVVKTEPASKRVRRRALECRDARPGACCKEDLYVSFKELGWDDWIIAPGGYRANYCRGNCSNYRSPDSHHNYHSHVMEEYRRLNKLVDMQPCCAPLRFSSMSLIYFDMDNNIIKRDLPKMVVEECGCP